MNKNHSEYYLCNINITYFATDDFKVTNQPRRDIIVKTQGNKYHKRALNMLTAYISTFYIF